MGTNGWIARGIHLAVQVYGCVAKDLVVPVQTWSILSAEAYAHTVCTHRFLFPIPDVSIVFKQAMMSSICLEETREDASSSGDAEPSEGGEGGLNVAMGKEKKRIAQLWHPYICT